MNKQYHINIQGLENLNDFVDQWSPSYSYPNEDKYNKYILDVFDNKDSFIELFKWKNGTGDRISEKKMKTVLGFWDKIEVLRELKSNFRWDEEFNWELFEKEFEPHKNSPIWKIFLLHLINHYKFPIFDQHVYRSYNFFINGKIEEIPNSSKSKYLIYKIEYKDWFNQLHEQFDTEPKKMDESFMSFGQMLKGLKKYPIEIRN